MNIVCHEDNTGFAPAAERFSAYDDDSYDGAEDSSNRSHVGRGATPEEAVIDLLDLLDDDGELTSDRVFNVLHDMGLDPYRGLGIDPDLAREDMAERAALMREWDE
jgi:hypothetical protein